MRFRQISAAFAAVASLAAAQGSSCGTPFTTWNITASNGQNGVMFDVENISINPVTICGMDINLDSSAIPLTIGVWTVTAGTSHVPVASNAAAWTQQALGPTTSLGINTTGIGNTFTPIPGALSITITPGQKLGIAVGCSQSTFINYQSGSAAQGVGTAISNDGVLNWYAGYGKAYLAGIGPFGNSFGSAAGGRLASVRLGYTQGTGSIYWELNSAASSMDIDGVATQFASAVSPSVRNQCASITSYLNVASTNAGSPFEIIFGTAPLVRGSFGALATPGGQYVNVDLADPNIGFVLGLTFSVPFASATVPFASPTPMNISTQLVNIDPTHVDGLALSAACRLAITGQSTLVTLAGSQLSDDGFYTLGSPPTTPTCVASVQPFSFYGISHSQFSVAMNGRLCIGPTSFAGEYLPSVTSAMTQTPFAGFWADLHPGIAATLPLPASIVIDWTTGTNLHVAYNNIVLFGTAAPQFSFSIDLDSSNGAITLSGVNQIPNPGTGGGGGSMFLGMSRAGTGATDPGATAFTIGSGSAPNPNAMLYAFGQPGTLAPGVTSIVFTPNLGAGYNWAAF